LLNQNGNSDIAVVRSGFGVREKMAEDEVDDFVDFSKAIDENIDPLIS
jgi:hypothetical protein